jgi:hypothetical protein
MSPVRHVSSWPLYILALPAAVAVWSGWVGLGQMCGFGVIHPLPGTPLSEWTLDTSITLPIGVEAYAAYALRVWLSGAVAVGGRAVAFARTSAIASLLLGAAGQVAYHLLHAAHRVEAPWTITMVVSALPVAVLGMGAALAHLVQADQGAESSEAPVTVVPEPVAGGSGGDPVTVAPALTPARTDALTPALTGTPEARTEARTDALTPARTDALTPARTDALTPARTDALTPALTGTPEARTPALTGTPDARTPARTDALTPALTDALTPARTEARRRTGPDTRTRVIRLHERHPDMSTSELAQRVGRSVATVRRYLAETRMAVAADDAPPALADDAPPALALADTSV